MISNNLSQRSSLLSSGDPVKAMKDKMIGQFKEQYGDNWKEQLKEQYTDQIGNLSDDQKKQLKEQYGSMLK